jgi:hypothetical protein
VCGIEDENAQKIASGVEMMSKEGEQGCALETQRDFVLFPDLPGLVEHVIELVEPEIPKAPLGL